MYILYILYSIPVEVRAAGYVGPTVELSESDKKYIVKLYSDIEEDIYRRASNNLEIIHS